MRFNLNSSRGFSLIEMAIVLLITGLLVGGSYQLITNMQQQRTDETAANELRGVTLALERFLSDHHESLKGNAVLQNTGSRAQLTDNITINVGGTNFGALTYFQRNYLTEANLPAGYDLTGNGYLIGIRNQDTNVNGRAIYKALILKRPLNTLTNVRQSRIANLVGTQGGLVRNRAPGPGVEITGGQGSWLVVDPFNQYGIAGAAVGQLAALTTTGYAQMASNVFSRINTGNPESNTMRADMIMGNAAGATQTAYAIRNAAGYGYTRTDATVSQVCDNQQVNLLDENGGGFTPERKLTTEKFMFVLGRAGLETSLLQCRDNGSGIYQWQQVGSFEYSPYLNGRIFAEQRDMDWFLGVTRTGQLYTRGEPRPPQWATVNFNTFRTSFPANQILNARRVSTTNGRSLHRWFYNDTGHPIVVTTLWTDGADWAFSMIKDNYNPSAPGGGRAPGPARLVDSTKARDEDGRYTMTMVVPVNAAYSIVMFRSNDSLCEVWLEYDAL